MRGTFWHRQRLDNFMFVFIVVARLFSFLLENRVFQVKCAFWSLFYRRIFSSNLARKIRVLKWFFTILLLTKNCGSTACKLARLFCKSFGAPCVYQVFWYEILTISIRTTATSSPSEVNLINLVYTWCTYELEFHPRAAHIKIIEVVPFSSPKNCSGNFRWKMANNFTLHLFDATQDFGPQK